VPRLRATGANQVWSWDITYLPTTVRGIWLYLYLVIDVWSRKVVAWEVDEREDPGRVPSCGVNLEARLP
jgi:transposase InsO family protein